MRASGPEDSGDLVRRTIDREFQLIEEAIELVASGASPRVVVGSMRFSDVVLDKARTSAATAGVHLTPIWTLDETHHAIAVEPGRG